MFHKSADDAAFERGERIFVAEYWQDQERTRLIAHPPDPDDRLGLVSFETEKS